MNQSRIQVNREYDAIQLNGCACDAPVRQWIHAGTRRAAPCATISETVGKCMPGGGPQGQGHPAGNCQKALEKLAKPRPVSKRF